jgi:hypothetical protein
MVAALVLFAVAAVGGIVLALIRFKGKPYPPLGIALVHGAVAAAGLVTLIAVIAQGAAGSSMATTALVLFIVAALGGFALFFHHLRKVALPIWLVVVHALVAVTAFLILLVTRQ